ncbi:MAG: hypothetical protein R3D67_18365 [Hyphomicrobiaceae bacterium]
MLDPKQLKVADAAKLIDEMVARYKKETKASVVTAHVSMGFNNT